jgi:hypothetical protein
MKSFITCLCAVIMFSVIFLTGWSMAQGTPTIAGCPIFPSNNVWNTPIDHLPVDSNSSVYIASIGATIGLHPDFGTIWEGAPIGIPYNIVPGTQPKVSITFDYNDESDPGPYPIPPGAVIEGGDASTGDRHILVLDEDHCILYETFYSWPQADGSWQAGSGAVYDLHSNSLRPSGWTSADAAGLPILPGLVRYDEVASGEITHALRFTVQHTRKAFIWPARHYASSLTATNYPPMGQRFRLKASFDISGFSPEVQVILRALKKYGMILADNGSNWYISGVPDSRWNDDTLVGELKLVKGSYFEAVNESSLMVDPDSGQVKSTTTVQLTTTVPPTTTSIILIDSDGDGIPNSTDNCPSKPNGPNLGTCSSTSDKPGITCTSDAACANGCSSNGLCIKDQRDGDGDGVGDVCDASPITTTVIVTTSTTSVRPTTTTTSVRPATTTTVVTTTTTALQTPAPPGNLTATAISSSRINLSWTDNSANETGFKIERAAASSGPFSQIAIVGTNVKTYQNTGLQRNTRCYYRVRAYNAAGDSAYSNTASAITLKK